MLRAVMFGCAMLVCMSAPACRRSPQGSPPPARRPVAQAWGGAPAKTYSLCPSSVPKPDCDAYVGGFDDEEEGGTGARAAGGEGKMGRQSEEVDRMAGVQGPTDLPNPHMARTTMLESVANLGAVGALTDLQQADELIVVEKQEGKEPWTPEASFCKSIDPAEPTQGTLQGRKDDGTEAGEFPLKHTEVTAEVSGFLARTVVEQQYTNPFQQVIEAVYVFPLPAMSAVNDFVMEVRDRKIVGLVRPRAEAERIYAEARARGQTASLLTQERPNIFTQSVANLEPGGEVRIRITYFESLLYEEGHYEYVFPMVVGPRYIPGSPQAAAETGGAASPAGGGGTSPATDLVDDADRITPPVLRPDQRSGHDIGITVKLDAGLPIRDLVTPTHCVQIDEYDVSRRVVSLSDRDTIPNRDFVLRWSVDGETLQLGMLTHRTEAGGFLALMAQPPAEASDAQVMPREITFLLDVSGSMQGAPLDLSTGVVRRSLDALRPDDLFNIFFFASGNGQLWQTPRPNTVANVSEAKAFLAQLEGGGGTEMLDGIRRALHGEHDRRRLQMFVFFTDGFIGNDDSVLEAIRDERGEARFFAFGIGSSVNRYLIDGIAQFGKGASHVVLPREGQNEERAAGRLFDLIDSPVLVDVSIDWNGLPVEDVFPREIGDLFAGQTIAVVARYSREARGTAYVKGRVGDRTVQFPIEVDLPADDSGNEALAPLWARWKIAELSGTRSETAADAENLERQITDVALEFRLMSPYTAFVAVDESRVVGDGQPLRVLQPVELPEGVSYEGVFGERPVGEAVEIATWGLTMQSVEGGRVRVGAATPGKPAAAAGIAGGAVVRAVNGTVVNDLVHLEGLLLQSAGEVRLTLEPGGQVTLPAP
ncbi:MAG: VWA domain-containing protein [Deltaproteobacteria bacterium]|nr:VWA domain-containing protein [Deltaproteobacteria bacterium]